MKKIRLNDKSRCDFSIALKILVISFVIAGVSITYYHGYSGGNKTFLYFTCQSNLWLAIFDFIALIFILYNYKNKQYQLNPIFHRFSQIFTTCILLTGIVYTFILAPGALLAPNEVPIEFDPFNVGAIFVHMVVPILALIDFLIYTRNTTFKKYESLYALIPVSGYFIFAIIGYFTHIDFGHGNNFPYFFLNFDNPAGFFGFSNQMPYVMGNFYWFILGFGIVICLSLILISAINKLVSKSKATNK